MYMYMYISVCIKISGKVILYSVSFIVYLLQSLQLTVVAEPTVLREELISEDRDFAETRSKLQTWNEGE